MDATATLTPEENAVYDRQLRVWGIHVQKRLQRAKILIVGDNGLFSEVSKNAVLAGIGSVVLCPGCSHVDHPSGTNFLANTYPYLPSTQACVRVLQEMNPLVSVSNLATTVDVEAVRSFDLVCFTGGSLSEQLELNAICREAAIKFCCARFAVDVLVQTDANEERHMEFNTLREAFGVDPKRLPKKLHGLYPVLRVCLEFELRHNRPATPADIDALHVLASEQLPEMHLESRILRQYLTHVAEFPPVCAVMGGMLANELVKIVSSKGDPVQNFLFYDVFDGKGILHLID